ncbi:indole-3-glycerol phosphate synthase TrpC [Blattabacterium cuenoti]|uniref:indole-3-glycerol phosphate synthase TrpC n=1 Tax=Blattabacterium cuenoti TaxID=1653831 RepID=UPI00163D1F73|nr:indole-3-glycerol phosphate synthase TrpC [Blattabacterium cuenoti]
MNILEKILYTKKKEVQIRKKINPIQKLEKHSFFKRKTFSLKKSIVKSNTGIIAEFKIKSPSKGIINKNIKLEKVVKDYENAGVCGVSILTDFHFFSGKNENLETSRMLLNIPLLRKDFIIDEYQIIESKSIGSDVILLISKFLKKEEIKNFSKLAKNLGLEVLFEVHNEHELENITDYIDFIGINNRDLNNFFVDHHLCFELCSKIPKDYIKIAESGINNKNRIMQLRKIGFQGFLIGEYFMKNRDPGEVCKNFIQSLEN